MSGSHSGYHYQVIDPHVVLGPIGLAAAGDNEVLTCTCSTHAGFISQGHGGGNQRKFGGGGGGGGGAIGIVCDSVPFRGVWV